MSIIEKLAKKYFKSTGESPEYGFWSFLEACGVNPTEKDLQRFYKELEDYLEKD